jgi:DNA-binding phage protein
VVRVPRRSSAYGAPREWLREGSWPDGTFSADTPEPVAHAVAIAVALDAALRGRNKSEVATGAGIERSTLYDILSGNAWPDTLTLAKLESHLGVTLWPDSPSPALRKHPRDP